MLGFSPLPDVEAFFRPPLSWEAIGALDDEKHDAFMVGWNDHLDGLFIDAQKIARQNPEWTKHPEITVAYTPSGGASDFASSNPADALIDLFHGIKAPYRANAVWGMNTTTLGKVRKFKDGQGRYLVNIQGLDNTPVTTILGRPVVEMPDMPDVNTNAFPIIFGDFSNGYRIFDRVSLEILRDPYTQRTNGMTRFHGRRRVAGGVGKAEALRKLKIATS